MERVVVTGMGAITPCGLDLASSWANLVAGQSGVGLITHFDTSAYAVKIAAEVKNWDGTRFIERKKLKEMDRYAEFTIGAASMAIRDAQLELTDEEREETGCITGVGIGGINAFERTKETNMNKGPSKMSPYSIPAIIANMGAGHVSMMFGLKGPTFTTTSACTSGAHAIGEAAEWIRHGRAQVMVAGGAEAAITQIGIGGFQAMYALSRRNDEPTRASRPFDKGRDGFVCGEGSGMLVLESLSRAKRRGAKIYAELKGYGASSDAYHLTQPSPEGEGAQRAIKSALKDAQLHADQIAYINAHATSTSVGDKNECSAIVKLFGDRRGGANPLFVSSTKSMTGHLLGAAGAIEAIFAAMVVHTGEIPPTINLEEQDPECPVDAVPNEARRASIKAALSNSFGFGGTNGSLIFTRFEE